MNERLPTDAELAAAYALAYGGPNPLYKCKHCDEIVLGVRNELVDHLLIHLVPSSS